MKLKPDRCESNTRSSNYTVRCKAKGFYCRSSKKFRCKNHGGLSTGPRTKQGKLKVLKNLKQFKNVSEITTDQSSVRKYLSKTNARKTFNSDMQREGIAKHKRNLQMD